MSITAETEPTSSDTLRAWWPLVLGVAAVLLSSYIRFAADVWPLPNNDHEPIVVGIALLLFWLKRADFKVAVGANHALAWFLLFAGIAALLLGARTKIVTLESAAHLPILIGAIWLFGGPRLVRRLWFPLLFLLLSIPLPTFVLATATGSLKEVVSQAAETVLYSAGYPVARDGVVLTIGNYQLLVAEACSGMNSIVSLSAIGLVYLYLSPPPRVWQSLLAALFIVPIAIAANIVRIILLILITYYFGDEAGQGFLHEFAGLAMFGFALIAFIAISTILSRLRPATRIGPGHA